MSYFRFDPDEWETDIRSTPCRACDGDMRRCNGACTGSASYGMKRRPQEEIDRIKTERQRQHEDAVLEEAERIKRRREGRA